MTSVKNKSYVRNPYFNLLLFCTIIMALGQYLLKRGISDLNLTLAGTLFNYPFVAGIIIYLVMAAAFMLVIKNIPLSIAYPVVGLSLAWVAILSTQLLGEYLSAFQWMGVIFVVIGVGLVGGSSIE